MKRRDFIQLAGMGAGAMAFPLSAFARITDPVSMLEPGIDNQQKKALADVALNTARSMGATYADVRIGRYLNQFVPT